MKFLFRKKVVDEQLALRPTAMKIVNLLKDGNPRHISEIISHCDDVTERSVYYALKFLQEIGYVEKVNKGVYRLKKGNPEIIIPSMIPFMILGIIMFPIALIYGDPYLYIFGSILIILSSIYEYILNKVFRRTEG